MASKAPNAANLEALGATRLAQLLIEISEGNAPAKRRLRLELAGPDSPTAVANQVRKRIATIARSRSFIDWHNRKSLVDDLEAQRRAVVDQVASRLPTEGLELMWDFSNWPSPSLPVVTTAAERSSTSSIRLSPTSVPSANRPDPALRNSQTGCSTRWCGTVTASLMMRHRQPRPIYGIFVAITVMN
jgi:hypothetical protein